MGPNDPVSCPMRSKIACPLCVARPGVRTLLTKTTPASNRIALVLPFTHPREQFAGCICKFAQ